MTIITYGNKHLTFKAETMKEAERILRRCEEDQGQISPDAPEPGPKLMSVEEYLAGAHLASLDGVAFDDPAYL